MAANSMINLKVFLRDDNVSEARRFTVDASVCTNFMFMKEKLQTVFPTIRDSEFKITWKDMDGDEITIASDEDFITAFTEMSSNVKVLYVTIVQRTHEPIFMLDGEPQDTTYRGPRVICDVCNQVISGFRYKCLQCPDYDLCTGCEHQGHHSEHLMIRVPNNDVYMPKCTRKFMHHVARSLKKSAYTASKEAHRAAKFACKFGPMGKPSCDENKAEQPQAQAGSSNQVPEEQPGCPFASGDPINMNDIHALGAMARQHLGPLLDVLQTPPPTASANNDQGGLLIMDIIRNAVDGFFGKIPDTDSTEQQQQEQQQPPRQAETPTEKQPSPQNSSTTGEKPQTPENQATPMDVEGAAREGPHVTFASNTTVSPQQPASDQRRDPGWTFVAANPPQTNENAANGNAQNPPTAPAFVYHENPRIAEGLVQLHEMGFSNESGYITHLLERHDGNVAAVVRAIVDTKL